MDSSIRRTHSQLLVRAKEVSLAGIRLASSCLQKHINMHRHTGANYSSPRRALQKAKFCKDHDVFMHALHVTLNRPKVMGSQSPTKVKGSGLLI